MRKQYVTSRKCCLVQKHLGQAWAQFPNWLNRSIYRIRYLLPQYHHHIDQNDYLYKLNIIFFQNNCVFLLITKLFWLNCMVKSNFETRLRLSSYWTICHCLFFSLILKSRTTLITTTTTATTTTATTSYECIFSSQKKKKRLSIFRTKENRFFLFDSKSQ